MYTKTDMEHSDNSLVLGQVLKGREAILPFSGHRATSGDIFSSQSSENLRGMLPNTLKYTKRPHKQLIIQPQKSIVQRMGNLTLGKWD